MDVPSALELLGVSEDINQDGLRRAYLRKIKIHKPEVDPEKFAKLRAAYELLKDYCDYDLCAIIDDDEPGAEDPGASAWPEHPNPPVSPSFAPRASETSASHLEQAFTFASTDQLDEAAREAERAVELMREELDGAAGVLGTMYIIAQLHVGQRHDAARQLTRNLAELIEQADSEVSLLSSGHAIRWALLKDLAVLEDLPTELTTAVAAVVRDQELEILEDTCLRVSKDLSWLARRRTRLSIKQDSAMLHHFAVPKLSPQPARLQQDAHSNLILVIVVAVFVSISAILRVFAPELGQRPTKPPPPPMDIVNVVQNTVVEGRVHEIFCERAVTERPCAALGVLKQAKVNCPQLKNARLYLGPYQKGVASDLLVSQGGKVAASELSSIVTGVVQMIKTSCPP